MCFQSWNNMIFAVISAYLVLTYNSFNHSVSPQNCCAASSLIYSCSQLIWSSTGALIPDQVFTISCEMLLRTEWNFFYKYLQNTLKWVVTNDTHSLYLITEPVVTQWSLLGPSLFINYMNNLKNKHIIKYLLRSCCTMLSLCVKELESSAIDINHDVNITLKTTHHWKILTPISPTGYWNYFYLA